MADAPAGLRRIDLCALDEVPPGTMKLVELPDGPDAGEMILVVNLDGELHATQGICSHQYFELDKGFLTGDSITCALHLSRFSFYDGEPLDPPAELPLAMYQVVSCSATTAALLRPVVLGAGTPLFPTRESQFDLRLVATHPFLRRSRQSQPAAQGLRGLSRLATAGTSGSSAAQSGGRAVDRRTTSSGVRTTSETSATGWPCSIICRSSSVAFRPISTPDCRTVVSGGFV